MQIRLLTLALKPTGDITRSLKQEYQWPHKKDLCSSNYFYKKVSGKTQSIKRFVSNSRTNYFFWHHFVVCKNLQLFKARPKNIKILFRNVEFNETGTHFRY